VEDMESLGWEEGGNAWRWRRRLLAWEEESLRECVVLLNNIILQVNRSDSWRWMLDPIHGYSVHGTYSFLTSADEPLHDVAVNNVWHKLIPSKVSIFAWRLLQDRIPTRSNLVRRLVLHSDNNLCVSGCGFIETMDHLFVVCNFFGRVWELICNWLGIYYVCPGSITDHFFQFTHLAGMPRSSFVFFKIIWLASTWAIWKERNSRVFANAVIDPHNIIERVKRNSFLWLSTNVVPIAFSFHDWWRHPLLCMGVL
jgi:hypothetical protein